MHTSSLDTYNRFSWTRTGLIRRRFCTWSVRRLTRPGQVRHRAHWLITWDDVGAWRPLAGCSAGTAALSAPASDTLVSAFIISVPYQQCRGHWPGGVAPGSSASRLKYEGLNAACVTAPHPKTRQYHVRTVACVVMAPFVRVV